MNPGPTFFGGARSEMESLSYRGGAGLVSHCRPVFSLRDLSQPLEHLELYPSIPSRAFLGAGASLSYLFHTPVQSASLKSQRDSVTAYKMAADDDATLGLESGEEDDVLMAAEKEAKKVRRRSYAPLHYSQTRH